MSSVSIGCAAERSRPSQRSRPGQSWREPRSNGPPREGRRNWRTFARCAASARARLLSCWWSPRTCPVRAQDRQRALLAPERRARPVRRHLLPSR